AQVVRCLSGFLLRSGQALRLRCSLLGTSFTQDDGELERVGWRRMLGMRDLVESRMDLGSLGPEITADEYARMRASGEPVILLDVREPWEYETAHLPGSILMPMAEVPSRAHAE